MPSLITSLSMLRPSAWLGSLTGGSNLDFDGSLDKGPRTSAVVILGLAPELYFLVGKTASGIPSVLPVKTKYRPASSQLIASK